MNNKKHFSFNKKDKKKTIKEFEKSKICRLKASERLSIYSNLSNWLFTIISLTLILISLLNSYEVIPLHNSSFFNFFQIGLAITILVVFQIISSSDYQVKALRFHQCGMEISAEIRKLRSVSVKKDIDDKAKDKIKQSLNEYTSILKRYDNHKRVDFLAYKLHQNTSSSRKKVYRECFFLVTLSYLPHILLLLITIIGSYYCFNFECLIITQP